MRPLLGVRSARSVSSRVHRGAAGAPDGLSGRAQRGFAPILIVTALLATVPLITSSNVVLNFLVVALLIALVGQGWNLLGGYGGQYSFGHAAFFGTGAYATAILQVQYGINAWPAFDRHRRGSPGRGRDRRAGLPVWVEGSYFALVTLAFAEVLRILASVAAITGAGVGTLIKLDLRPETFQFQSRAPFYWTILALVGISLGAPDHREQPFRRGSGRGT